MRPKLRNIKSPLAEQSYSIINLDSGIRVLHFPHSSQVTHCGFLIDVGSRDEQADEMGMAHFIEHMFFKGTEKRKTLQVLNCLEYVGGEMNAYTTKDKTALYASVNKDYFKKAADLLFDMVFKPSFPEEEIKKEVKVIQEEIDMYQDSPEENIIDLFQEYAFPNNSLGYNILGSHQTLNTFNQEKVFRFYKPKYNPNKMVFFYNGNLSASDCLRTLQKLSSKYVPEQPNTIYQRKGLDSNTYKAFNKTIQAKHVQSYLMIGGLAYNNHDSRRLSASLLFNILGGPTLNSKLNLLIREKYAFAYDVEASYQSLPDIGLFHVYVGTDKKYLDKTKQLIIKELKSLKNNHISNLSLNRYKNQFKGQLLLSEENRISVSLTESKMLLDGRKIETMQHVFDQIEAVQSAELCAIANELFEEKNLSELLFEEQKTK